MVDTAFSARWARVRNTHTFDVARDARIIVDNRTTRDANDTLCDRVCDAFNAGTLTREEYNDFLDLFAYVARKNVREGRAYVIMCMYETSRRFVYRRAYIHDACAGITCRVYRWHTGGNVVRDLRGHAYKTQRWSATT